MLLFRHVPSGPQYPQQQQQQQQQQLGARGYAQGGGPGQGQPGQLMSGPGGAELGQGPYLQGPGQGIPGSIYSQGGAYANPNSQGGAYNANPNSYPPGQQGLGYAPPSGYQQQRQQQQGGAYPNNSYPGQQGAPVMLLPSGMDRPAMQPPPNFNSSIQRGQGQGQGQQVFTRVSSAPGAPPQQQPPPPGLQRHSTSNPPHHHTGCHLPPSMASRQLAKSSMVS